MFNQRIGIQNPQPQPPISPALVVVLVANHHRPRRHSTSPPPFDSPSSENDWPSDVRHLGRSGRMSPVYTAFTVGQRVGNAHLSVLLPTGQTSRAFFDA
jgi:hypothetical protein